MKFIGLGFQNQNMDRTDTHTHTCGHICRQTDRQTDMWQHLQVVITALLRHCEMPVKHSFTLHSSKATMFSCFTSDRS